ncbi:hypothetical protein BDW72DRAFT_186842 [Aspergillus terricola var. indicus]
MDTFMFQDRKPCLYFKVLTADALLRFGEAPLVRGKDRSSAVIKRRTFQVLLHLADKL